jgi:ATP-dependent DNA ligase
MRRISLRDLFNRDPRPDDMIEVPEETTTATAAASATATPPSDPSAAAASFEARERELAEREARIAQREQDQAQAARAAALAECDRRADAYAATLTTGRRLFGAVAATARDAYAQAARDDLDHPLSEGSRTAVLDDLAASLPEHQIGELASTATVPASSAAANGDQALPNQTGATLDTGRPLSVEEWEKALRQSDTGRKALADPARREALLSQARDRGYVV